MKNEAGANLADVAVRVGHALRSSGIRAVLTGGACAHIRSGGIYTSRDVDFVLLEIPTQAELDGALESQGFRRERDRYVHVGHDLVVEFPPGPLAIGADHRIRPVLLRRRSWRTLALSPTDSCRDRLAAFYHWNDRQALSAAVAIARRHRVNVRKIKEWSRREEAVAGFEEFEQRIAAVRATSRQRRSR